MLERLKASKERRGEGGFTLIELLIVIIILAILAAIVVFAVGTTTKNASVAACQSTVKTAQTALESFKAQTGQYPATLATLKTKTTVNGVKSGPWLHTVPLATPTGSVKYGIKYVAPTTLTTGNYTLNVKVGAVTASADATPNPCTAA